MIADCVAPTDLLAVTREKAPVSQVAVWGWGVGGSQCQLQFCYFSAVTLTPQKLVLAEGLNLRLWSTHRQ